MITRIPANEIRSIYLSLPIPACMIDRETRFIAANHKYAELMNTPLEHVVGHLMDGINPPEHIANVRRDFATFDSGGRVDDHEILLNENIHLVSVSPFHHNDAPSPTAISVTLIDITHRKAIERELAEAYKRLEEVSETDALTMLPNRRALEKFFVTELSRCKRDRTPIAVMILDLDFFKNYNDLYGHLLGDACLQAVAKAIHEAIRRPGDSVARFGGEEFVVILPNTDIAGARRVADNIQKAVSDLTIQHEGNPHGRVTASIGIAGMSPTHSDSNLASARDILLQAADKALYRAKAAGRNVIEVEGRSP